MPLFIDLAYSNPVYMRAEPDRPYIAGQFVTLSPVEARKVLEEEMKLPHDSDYHFLQAIENRDAPAIELYLAAKSVDVKWLIPGTRETILDRAIGSGGWNTVKLFVKAGAIVPGGSQFAMALQQKDRAAIEEWLTADVSVVAGFLAPAIVDIEILKKVLNRLGDRAAAAINGRQNLKGRSFLGHPDRWLYASYSALLNYALRADATLDVIKLLIAHGADIRALDALANDGYRPETALMTAVSASRPEVVELLIKAGVDVNVSVAHRTDPGDKQRQARTALSYARLIDRQARVVRTAEEQFHLDVKMSLGDVLIWQPAPEDRRRKVLDLLLAAQAKEPTDADTLRALSLQATDRKLAENNGSELCTVINGVPYFIQKPGKYCLAKDLTLDARTDAPAAITIFADDVLIDLGGHSLRGPGKLSGIFGGGTNVTIRNGTVEGFYNGVLLGHRAELVPPHNMVVENMLVRDNVGSGIYVMGRDTVVRNNRLENNGGAEFRQYGSHHAGGTAMALHVEEGSGARILDNRITGTRAAGDAIAHGIYLVAGNSRSKILGNDVTGSGKTHAITLENCLEVSVANNTIKQATRGITVKLSSREPRDPRLTKQSKFYFEQDNDIQLTSESEPKH